MTIQFNKSEKFLNAKKDLAQVLQNSESTQEQHTEAYENFFNALKEDVTNAAIKEAQNAQADQAILASRGNNVLTSEEKKFFNEIKNEALDGIFKEEKILPRTTVDRIFEDLVKQRPLLQEIGLVNMGAVTKFIYADPTLAYAWKDIFGDITAQVNAAYRENEMPLLKITSFGVIPNDMLEFGPEYIERYMRTLLVESLAQGLEYGFLLGRGMAQKEPIGLTKDFDPETMAVTDKVSKGTLTFAPSEYGKTISEELYQVVRELSVDAKGQSVDLSRGVVMVVSPADLIAVQARNTIQTQNGTWVTALPYNITVIASEHMPANQTVVFARGRYDAGIGGTYNLKKFDQTLAMEDATLYTIKNFANGKARDNNAAVVFDLDLDLPAATPPETPTP